MPPERWASQRPTIIDVAALSGVSKSTVSNVLRGAGRVSDTTRGRVLEAIPLNPQKRAANLDRLKVIAEFVHDMDPAHPPVLDTIVGLKTSEWEQARPRMAEELRL